MLAHATDPLNSLANTLKGTLRLYNLPYAVISLADTKPGNAYGLIGAFFKGFNDTLNLLSRNTCFAGQGADFISYYSKTAALLTSPGRFNCSIEGEQVGLISNRLDHPSSGHDLLGFIGEVIHSNADIRYRTSQKLNGLSGSPGDFVALFSQFICCLRLSGGLLNMPSYLAD